MRTPYFAPENFQRCEIDLTDGAVAHSLFAIPEEREPHPSLEQLTEI